MTKTKTDQTRRRLLRLLEYMLIRRPDEFGLVPVSGWYRLKDVLQALQEEGRPCRESQLGELNHLAVAESKPPPFEIEAGRIKPADAQGPQPVVVDEVPAILYGFCRRRAHAVVAEKGLIARDGELYLLAADEEMAVRLGRRRDPEPVVFIVEARQAAAAGVAFLRLGQALHLCSRMPARFLRTPPLPKQREEKARPAPPRPDGPAMPAEDELPGSFILRPEPEQGRRKGRDDERRRPKKGWQRARRQERRRKKDQF